MGHSTRATCTHRRKSTSLSRWCPIGQTLQRQGTLRWREPGGGRTPTGPFTHLWRGRSSPSVRSPARSLRATESGNVPSGKSFFRNWRTTMPGQSGPQAVALTVARAVADPLRVLGQPWSFSPFCFLSTSSSPPTHKPNYSSRKATKPNSSSSYSYGLFSLDIYLYSHYYKVTSNKVTTTWMYIEWLRHHQ